MTQRLEAVDLNGGAKIGSVALGIPFYGSVHTLNAMYLLNHLAYGIGARLYGTLSFVEGAYVDHARNTIVRNVLASADEDETLTHLFFHDQDVICGEDVLPRLLSHGLPVVGAAYYGRDAEHLPIAFDIEPFGRLRDFDPDGLTQVGGIGMGATLIELDVFRKMAPHVTLASEQIVDLGVWAPALDFAEARARLLEAHPTCDVLAESEAERWVKLSRPFEWWFRCQDNPGREERRTGEDIWFAHRCRDLGVPIYLDAGADARHVGLVPIGKRHYLEARAAREGRRAKEAV